MEKDERNGDKKVDRDKNFVATIYAYMVKQMHALLCKEIGGQFCKSPSESSASLSLSFCAEEACELKNVDVARNYHTRMIASDKKNPEVWLEYACFLKRIKEMDGATECCREAIALCSRHKIALLLHGLILAEKKQDRDAEIFLGVVTRLYPRFAEGWAILHLFYLRTECFSGADVTIQVARKCLKDEDRDTVTSQYLNRDPLAWSAYKYPQDRIYILTAVLLLKMACCDFAAIAFAQEMSLMGRSTSLLHLMAVHHYMQHRYGDALSHLAEAQRQHGMDHSIGTLMGHCHYEEGNFDNAINCYEFANTAFDRPKNSHLMQLRLGYHYIEIGRHVDAKRILLVTCENSPTSRTWLGVGIACYNMREAEMVLNEANRIDLHNSEVWGYLCLLNMSMQRYDEFAKCYRQFIKNCNCTNYSALLTPDIFIILTSVKVTEVLQGYYSQIHEVQYSHRNNLENVKLSLMITEMMEDLGYSIPALKIISRDNIMVEESGGEIEEKNWGEDVKTQLDLPPSTPP